MLSISRARAVIPGECVTGIGIGIGQSNDFLPAANVTLYSFATPRPLRRRAPSQTNAELRDLDFIELHDSFTISELNPYDVLGITARGDGKRALDEGWVYAEGPRPVNPSGGGGLAVAYFATPASSPMTVLEAC